MPESFQNTSGAIGPIDNPAGSANSQVENFINGAGDATFFNAFQNSGNLNNLKGDTPTVLVYPEDIHNNPTKGNLVHFDVFYKKPAKMEDVTNSTKDIFSSAKDAISGLGEDISSGVGQIFSGGNPLSNAGNLLSGIGTPNDESVQKREQLEVDNVSEDTRLGKATEKSLDKVTLYMPVGLQNTDSLTYSDQDFGLIKGILDAEIGALVPGLAAKAAGFADSLSEIAGGGLNSEAALNAVTGAVKNPRKEQLFNDVEYRTFEFAFNFFPRSKKESHDVMEIIKLFRFHAHPEVSNNQAFYNMPSEFQISFIDIEYPSLNPLQQIGSFLGAEYSGTVAKENQWINKIGRTALTNVSVNYTPLDRLSMFPDGAPTAVSMTLQFTELESINRNKIKIGY